MAANHEKRGGVVRTTGVKMHSKLEWDLLWAEIEYNADVYEEDQSVTRTRTGVGGYMTLAENNKVC